MVYIAIKTHKYIFDYCGVTDDKIHFGVPGGSVTETWRVRLRSPGLKFRTLCLYRAVSSDSSHHPVQPVCAQIVLNTWNTKNLENQHLKYQQMHPDSDHGLSQGHNSSEI